MTPSSTPEPPDVDAAEDAVHAVLDGEATPEQRRLVARDPRLVARREELRQVADAVADAPPPLPADVLDRMRARALAAADDPDATGATDAARPDAEDGAAVASPPVEGATPLAPRRAARSRRWPALPAVAAGVLVLVAIGVGLILSDRGGDDQAATDATAEAGEGSPAPDFDVQGSYPSQDALREALQEVDPTTLAGVATGGQDGDGLGEAQEGATADGRAPDESPAASATDEQGGDDDGGAAAAGPGMALDPAAQRCDTVLRSTDERIGPAQAAVVVEVDGAPMLILSNPVSDGDESHVQLTVLDATGCVPQLAVRR